MTLDLLHNKIIKETLTESFEKSVNDNLVPKLQALYGASLEGVQLYEDYINDSFVKDGYWYYPLTVVIGGIHAVVWIKWDISVSADFKNGNPYAYVGNGGIDFIFADDVPIAFKNALEGRSTYFEGGCVKMNVATDAPDPEMLSGKYSQTFVDEMNRQISAAISRACGIKGLAESSIELDIVFAPNTYMEHTSENVTYRRLLISAKGCSARDFWIKWTRKNSSVAYSVNDNVASDDIVFELGEDVSQKIREKEYRFLVYGNSDKYRVAMGRKNVTEWRELIKRCIKRGELVKCESEEKAEAEPKNELREKLQEALGTYTQTVEKLPEETVDNSDLTSLLRSVLGASDTLSEEPATEVEQTIEEIAEESSEEATQKTAEPEEESLLDVPFDLTPVAEELTEEPSEPVAEPIAELSVDEEELRARLEEKIREKLLVEMRERAEAEKAELLLAQEKLRLENERLLEIARRAEEERAAKQEKEREEAEKIRLEAQTRAIAEAKERETIEQAARAALLEEQRLAERRAAEEAIAAERARIEEERARLEAERLERERAEEAARAIEAREEKPAAPRYTYVSKNARLLFRMQIDPNITKRIHEIILATIKYFHKEDIFIKIKATIPDSTTVNLHFEKIPEEENELLINIIKVLGKSDLGITKVFLE